MMQENTIVVEVDVDKLRDWVTIVNPGFVAIRPPEFFEKMGFPPTFVRRHMEDLVSVCGHGSPGHKIVRGISDATFLRSVAAGMGADTSEGDAKLCWTNRIIAWQEACLHKLDEIEHRDH